MARRRWTRHLVITGQRKAISDLVKHQFPGEHDERRKEISVALSSASKCPNIRNAKEYLPSYKRQSLVSKNNDKDLDGVLVSCLTPLLKYSPKIVKAEMNSNDARQIKYRQKVMATAYDLTTNAFLSLKSRVLGVRWKNTSNSKGGLAGVGWCVLYLVEAGKKKKVINPQPMLVDQDDKCTSTRHLGGRSVAIQTTANASTSTEAADVSLRPSRTIVFQDDLYTLLIKNRDHQTAHSSRMDISDSEASPSYNKSVSVTKNSEAPKRTCQCTAPKGSRKSPARLTYYSLDELMNRWLLDILEDERIFLHQASEINKSEFFIRYNSAQEFDHLLKPLEEFYFKMEPTDIPRYCICCYEDILTDLLFVYRYHSAEVMDYQLKQINLELHELITQLNQSSSNRLHPWTGNSNPSATKCSKRSGSSKCSASDSSNSSPGTGSIWSSLGWDVQRQINNKASQRLNLYSFTVEAQGHRHFLVTYKTAKLRFNSTRNVEVAGNGKNLTEGIPPEPPSCNPSPRALPHLLEAAKHAQHQYHMPRQGLTRKDRRRNKLINQEKKVENFVRKDDESRTNKDVPCYLVQMEAHFDKTFVLTIKKRDLINTVSLKEMDDVFIAMATSNDRTYSRVTSTR
ncbi:hypothetical protein C0J52_02997 [Blattella germanica]|nr:hypothetical protein C0J52_02997 [Blattella germanica]